MSDIAIRVEDLSKQYRIGGFQAPYKTIRESLTEAALAPFRRTAQLLRGQAYGAADTDETIWALKDVSFEVEQGEVVGIIGRNGAGKTTLLKVLSQITKPTEGRAEIHGRVRSLLEVGTGFHPELTGRENIYLNGAVLGMTKAEIDRKFDEIVDFSGVEKFIDTPVKRYSSGMKVRLAFSVAAHLEPEILLVDEVLAVGDYEFQRKCLGKMEDVGQGGRTVLFVSHNMRAMRTLCPTAILLDHGKIKAIGETNSVIDQYIHSDDQLTSERFFEAGEGAIADGIRLFSVRVLNANHVPSSTYDIEDLIYVEIEFCADKDYDPLTLHLHFYKDGILGFTAISPGSVSQSLGAGRKASVRATATIPQNTLNVGFYEVGVTFSEGIGYRRSLGGLRSAVSFRAGHQSVPKIGDSFSMKYTRWDGIVRPKVDWQCEHLA